MSSGRRDPKDARSGLGLTEGNEDQCTSGGSSLRKRR